MGTVSTPGPAEPPCRTAVQNCPELARLSCIPTQPHPTLLCFLPGAFLQRPKYGGDIEGFAGGAGLVAGDSELKRPLARQRWHHVFLAATPDNRCTLHVDGKLLAEKNCTLSSVFPVCRIGANYTLTVGGFKG